MVIELTNKIMFHKIIILTVFYSIHFILTYKILSHISIFYMSKMQEKLAFLILQSGKQLRKTEIQKNM